LTKYLFESDIKIPQEKRWLWLQYVDAFNPKDDWMELSDESIHSVQNFIIFDLVPIIIS
jgi:hypothetical protein